MKAKYWLIVFISLFFSAAAFAKEYDIVNIFEKVRIDDGTRGIDEWGHVKELDYLLVPTKLNAGTYNVNITRKESDIYLLEGTDIYVETKYCYEYCTRKEAILVIKNLGYRIDGTLIILD